MSAACAAMSVATSSSPRAALHWYPARRLPSSASTQSTASRHPGPFQCSHRAAASRAKYAACRSRVRSSAPASANRSSANWRMVSKRLYRVRVAVWSATTSDFRTSESRCRSTSTSSAPSTTAQMLVRSKPPAKTDVRRSSSRSSSVKQVVRPLDRMAERELSLRPRRRPLQQPEPIGEPIPDLDRAHRRHPRRGQLDPEREPVEGLADLGHRGGGLRLREPEVGPDGPRPVDEQRDGVGGHATVQRERRDGEHRLAVDREGLARRGEDLDVPRTGRGSPRSADAAAARTCSQLSTTSRSRRPPSASATVSMSGVSPCGRDAQHGRDRRRDRGRVADRRELDHPHAVGELAGHLGPDFEGEPGLADPADAAQRDQPARPHELGDLGDHAPRGRRASSAAAGGCPRRRRRCGAPGTPPGARRRRPGTPTSVRAGRGAGAHPAAAAPRGCAAAPRSRPRRAPDRRARATSAAPRGSPRCRSSSGRVRSPHRCADPSEPRS